MYPRGEREPTRTRREAAVAAWLAEMRAPAVEKIYIGNADADADAALSRYDQCVMSGKLDQRASGGG